MEPNQTAQGNESFGLLPDSMEIIGGDHLHPADEDLRLYTEEDGTPLNTKKREEIKSTTPGLIIEMNHLQPKDEADHELAIQGSPRNLLLVVYKALCIRQSIQT